MHRAAPMKSLFLRRVAFPLLALSAALLGCGDDPQTAASGPAASARPPTSSLGPPPSGANPAGPSPPAGPTWCAGQSSHAFCADFDSESAAPLRGFNRSGAPAKIGGGLSIATSNRSAPNALAFTTAAAPSDIERDVVVAGATSGSFEADFFVDAFETTSIQSFTLILFDANESFAAAVLAFASDGMDLTGVALDSGGTRPVTVGAPAIARARWLRRGLALARLSNGWQAVATVDGATVATAPIDMPSATFERMRVNIGTFSEHSGAGTPFRALVDNVVADAR